MCESPGWPGTWITCLCLPSDGIKSVYQDSQWQPLLLPPLAPLPAPLPLFPSL
ncbi:lymphocyte antigen 96, isoform CRA_b [Rattus norvegicus]|uniref:Lymphocyte antigen 96, isoform CRA_b n=1 Tax=Rattus norvegicus TaxID=10116 RepID=A6JF94_RAT|nr:lymphocyte antigen 96, isoform CRA_b [Rattus norvegicus]